MGDNQNSRPERMLDAGQAIEIPSAHWDHCDSTTIF